MKDVGRIVARLEGGLRLCQTRGCEWASIEMVVVVRSKREPIIDGVLDASVATCSLFRPVAPTTAPQPAQSLRIVDMGPERSEHCRSHPLLGLPPDRHLVIPPCPFPSSSSAAASAWSCGPSFLLVLYALILPNPTPLLNLELSATGHYNPRALNPCPSSSSGSLTSTPPTSQVSPQDTLQDTHDGRCTTRFFGDHLSRTERNEVHERSVSSFSTSLLRPFTDAYIQPLAS